MYSEDTIRQMMLTWSLATPRARENVETALLTTKIARVGELEGIGKVGVTMDPEWASSMSWLLNDEDMQEAVSVALQRLKALAAERTPEPGQAPVELTALVYWRGLSDMQKSTLEDVSIEQAQQVIASRYGPDEPEFRFCQPIHIPLDPDDDFADATITLDYAHVMYVSMVEQGFLTDYGKPSDGAEGETSDGTRFAALFFWHGVKRDEKKRRKGLFKRG